MDCSKTENFHKNFHAKTNLFFMQENKCYQLITELKFTNLQRK